MSSEVLERARERYAAHYTIGGAVRLDLMADDFAALLAEVARCQERFERIEATLAVAREREQRLREKAQAVVDADDERKAAWASGQHTNITRWIPTEEATAALRAALVDEPAADEPGETHG